MIVTMLNEGAIGMLSDIYQYPDIADAVLWGYENDISIEKVTDYYNIMREEENRPKMRDDLLYFMCNLWKKYYIEMLWTKFRVPDPASREVLDRYGEMENGARRLQYELYPLPLKLIEDNFGKNTENIIKGMMSELSNAAAPYAWQVSAPYVRQKYLLYDDKDTSDKAARYLSMITRIPIEMTCYESVKADGRWKYDRENNPNNFARLYYNGKLIDEVHFDVNAEDKATTVA